MVIVSMTKELYANEHTVVKIYLRWLQEAVAAGIWNALLRNHLLVV